MVTNLEEIALETTEIIHAVDMGEALERLEKNPDFQKIIVEGYLNHKVQASVSLLAVPDIKQRGERPAIFEDIISASNLQFFFHMITRDYESAMQDASGELEEDFNEDEEGLQH